MKLRVMCYVIALAVAMTHTASAVVNVQLNLRYTDPANEAAGGTWELLAGSDGGGIAGISVLFDNINNDAAAAGSSGFEVFESQTIGTVTEIVIGSNLVPPLDTDIGLGPGTTGNVEDDLFPGNSPAIWANNALLASGSFGATRPSFLMTSGTLASGVNEFSGTSAVAATFGVVSVRGDGVDADGLSLGDANRDGIVGVTDLLIVTSNLDQPGGWDQGDFNSSQFVDNDDLAILLGNIPEPTTLGLAGIAMLGFAGIRRRR